jgi:hypothetical protein
LRRYFAGMLLAYATTLFLSATLLFLVQPMIAKMILPLLGGTPAVWNTCMVFFQAVLLAGYTYAHLTTSWLGVRRQAVVHLILLLTPLVVLPISVSEGWVRSGDANPIPWLLGLLLASVGLPFFVVSTSAPLLQKWFASTGHPSAQDPYFLYGASNLGSMLALLSYPTLIEPHLSLAARTWLSQSWLWAFGYFLLVLLTFVCALYVWRAPVRVEKSSGAQREPGRKLTKDARFDTAIAAASGQREPGGKLAKDSVSEAPAIWLRLRWVVLALVPSSLMLGVTTYLATDIASLPLLWVVPLALYLLSFILVFARLPALIHQGMVLIMPVLILLLLFLMLTGLKPNMATVIGLHLLAFFVVAMVCHGELAQSRPATEFLTQFYLLMSLGGVLGGICNAILAPLLFNSVIEYTLAMIFASLLLPPLGVSSWPRVSRWLDFVVPVVLGGLTLGLLFLFDPGRYPKAGEALGWLYDHLQEGLQFIGYAENGLTKYRLRLILQLGIPAVICYAFVSRPIRFGLGVAALIVAHGYYTGIESYTVLHQERSFFGVLRVEFDPDTHSHRLVHGTTLHGKQRWVSDPDVLTCFFTPLGAASPIEAAVALLVGQDEASERLHEALTYYHLSGPIGQIFEALGGVRRSQPMALIGLGTGTLSSYGRPGQEVTYYDIDAAVEKIARNPKYFTYLQDAEQRGVRLNVVMGDARLQLQQAPNGHYSLIIVDAFSSDAIPIHLLTREAIQMYLEKLAPEGILAIHISNRYLHLEPVLGNVAQELGLAGRVQVDREEDKPGKSSSDWAVLARRETDLGELVNDKRWEPLELKPKLGVWTDDYSNVLSIFNWR